MKSLLVMFAVGILWGCAPVGDGNESAAKFTGGGEVEQSPVAPRSGKYYIGVRRHAVVFVLPDRGEVGAISRRNIKGTEVDIYVEVDFGEDGEPVVNIKNSGNPNECDQIPADALIHEGENSKNYWNADWNADWTNVKDQNFSVKLNQMGRHNSKKPYKYKVSLDFLVDYDMRTNSGVESVSYRVIETLYHETVTEVNSGNHLPLKDVKAKFGSGDNCGESDSGENDNGNP